MLLALGVVVFLINSKIANSICVTPCKWAPEWTQHLEPYYNILVAFILLLTVVLVYFIVRILNDFTQRHFHQNIKKKLYLSAVIPFVFVLLFMKIQYSICFGPGTRETPVERFLCVCVDGLNPPVEAVTEIVLYTFLRVTPLCFSGVEFCAILFALYGSIVTFALIGISVYYSYFLIRNIGKKPKVRPKKK